MSYPVYTGKTAVSITIPELDPFFTENRDPREWHPLKFAQITSSPTSMDPFLEGLRLIALRGKGSIPVYARKCSRFLETVAGQEIVGDAAGILKLRRANRRKTLTEKSFLLDEDNRFYENLSKFQEASSSSSGPRPSKKRPTP
ncbi:hypothetical protein BGX31_005823, partial [Mortierella sp. GBA43]